MPTAVILRSRWCATRVARSMQDASRVAMRTGSPARSSGCLGSRPGNTRTRATYARGGAGVDISFVTVATSLGRLLVAATERGVCRVMLGDNAATLESDLRREFDAARVHRDTGGKLEGFVDAILSYLEGREPHLELPLDIRATAFQRRVWQELQRIPFGATRTYSEVAAAVGDPNARRAVARACATNPVALVIPCHRVVREDGALGGYRWGVERKEALLEKERDA
jgi:AraC family transcriptional regulator, regulatory protein of adaptative response / methylated-DNA-[protein]-cysteine methyltransferase